jgi:flagellar motility protein MotE (MotC chaperone)
MKPFRNIRVLPVVLTAVFGLAVLKIAGLVLDGGYVFDYQPESTKPSWAQETFNFPGRSGADTSDITGSVEKEKEKPKEEAKPPEVAKAETTANPEPAPVSASERAILERLQARRQELEARSREIDIRESLLKSAEKRAEGRVEEMKAIESRISGAAQQKADEDAARFKGIITMYEGMKPKDAARVFDRLEMPVLFDIASHIGHARWPTFSARCRPTWPNGSRSRWRAGPAAAMGAARKPTCQRSKARYCRRRRPINADH